MNESDVPEVAELIKAILSKLEANKDVLRRSTRWRRHRVGLDHKSCLQGATEAAPLTTTRIVARSGREASIGPGKGPLEIRWPRSRDDLNLYR